VVIEERDTRPRFIVGGALEGIVRSVEGVERAVLKQIDGAVGRRKRAGR
jgi:hypothetical protein